MSTVRRTVAVALAGALIVTAAAGTVPQASAAQTTAAQTTAAQPLAVVAPQPAQPVPGHTRVVPEEPRTGQAQIVDGEIFDLEVIGTRVFVAGSFTGIRNNQPGNTTAYAQPGLAAYDLATGLVDTRFRPVIVGGVAAVEASPDGTALFIGGTFSTINGVTKRRVARLDPITGAAVAGFTATANSAVDALEATNSTLYIGGRFVTINGVPRASLAAVSASTGAVDAGFNLPLSGGIGVNGALTIQQLRLTADESTLLLVHTARRVAGQDRYGAALIDTAAKALRPWRTRLWEDNLGFVGGIQRAYGADISPDGSYFVVGSGSGGDRPPINDTAVALPTAGGDFVQPRWVTRSFDSVYSIAITEKAVYLGGHISFTESQTAPDPWPGLDTVGYGTGQGLGAYALGDQVVRRDHIAALDPANGKALEWNPGHSSYEGDKAMKAIGRGLLVGGDGNITNGVATGRVAFFDLASVPPAGANETAITAPVEGRVVATSTPFEVTGTATATSGVRQVRVQVKYKNATRWLQDDKVTWSSAFNTIDVTPTSPGATSSSWRLPLSLSVATNLQLIAQTVGTDGTSDATQATKRIETFNLADLTPATVVTLPPVGLVTATTFPVTGTATDDNGVASITYYARQGVRYLQRDGTLGETYTTFRVLPDVVGAKEATWQTELTLPTQGEWVFVAIATDNAGQTDIRGALRRWTIDVGGAPPRVAINTPTAMVPPTAAAPIAVAPGSPMTFTGTANDESSLTRVEVALSNTSTGLRLATDGVWSKDAVAGWLRVSPSAGIGAKDYSWSWTTPFALTAGAYAFTVRAVDGTGLTTTNATLAKLSFTVGAPGDAFPDTRLDLTGTDQSATELRIDVSGTATDDRGVSAVRVAYFDNDTGRYLQPNGTLAGTYADLPAVLTPVGGTSTTFSLGAVLPTVGDYTVTAIAYDTAGQPDLVSTGAFARYLVYPTDGPPALSTTLASPRDGDTFTESRVVVSGRAEDDVAIGRLDVGIADSLGRWLGSTGLFDAAAEDYRTAFLNSPGSPGSNYSYTSPPLPPGAYTVFVRAVDAHGKVMPTPRQSRVTVSAPPANAAPVARGSVNCTANLCIFDARASTDENAPTLTYAWAFGDTRTSKVAVPRKYYTRPGTYTPTLTVTDEYGATSTTTMAPLTITTPPANVAPVAVLNPPACVRLVCTLSAVGTADANTGDIVLYRWDFGDGTPASRLAAVVHTFPRAGTFTVTMTATDGWGTPSTATRTVTVTP